MPEKTVPSPRAGGAPPYELLLVARQYSQDFIEQQRPLFEADIRAHWPTRSLLRWNDSYYKSNTRCQWLGWLACAKAQEARRG